jgi:uncharacterized membrane protein
MPATQTEKETGSKDGARKNLVHIKVGKSGHLHPVNQVHHDDATVGERLADKAAAGIGSWTFLVVQTIAVILWILGNLYLLEKKPFDPYPVILLNLLFSVQAAYTGPVLLLAGNRQAQKDRLTLEHAAAEADKADQQNQEILIQIAKTAEQNQQILIEIQKSTVRSEEILAEIRSTASQNRQILQHLEEIASSRDRPT